MTRIGFFKVTLAAALLAGSLAAQDAAPVRGPVTGFVFDREAGIRPILGIPGAATLGPAILRTSVFDPVVFSPSGDYALAIVPRGGQVALLSRLSSAFASAYLQVPPGPSKLAISPSGGAAALYHPATRSVTVLTGLPDAPTVAWSMETPYLEGGATTLAVSDGGDAALVAAAGAQSAVWLLAPATGPQFLMEAMAAPSAAFFPVSSDVVVADEGAGTVTVIRDPLGQRQASQVGGPAEGVSHPVAVAVTAGNGRVLVANSEPAGMVSLSLAGEGSEALPCNCKVTGLERLAGGTAFRLNEAAEGPLYIVDAGDSAPRVVFVPNPPPAPRRILRAPLPIRVRGAL